jgi:TATA-binding protein-associated factor Taf7
MTSIFYGGKLRKILNKTCDGFGVLHGKQYLYDDNGKEMIIRFDKGVINKEDEKMFLKAMCIYYDCECSGCEEYYIKGSDEYIENLLGWTFNDDDDEDNNEDNNEDDNNEDEDNNDEDNEDDNNEDDDDDDDEDDDTEKSLSDRDKYWYSMKELRSELEELRSQVDELMKRYGGNYDNKDF